MEAGDCRRGGVRAVITKDRREDAKASAMDHGRIILTLSVTRSGSWIMDGPNPSFGLSTDSSWGKPVLAEVGQTDRWGNSRTPADPWSATAVLYARACRLSSDSSQFKSVLPLSQTQHRKMEMQLLLLVLAVAVSGVRADLPPSNKLVFILAGQSNMAGRGGVVGNHWDGIVPFDCAPSPSVLRLTADLRWEQAREPLHAGIDSANHAVGVGPGMSFANALLRSGRAGEPVLGLVPCAVGGTRMAEWAKGTQLYDDMLRRARVAVETGGRIGALLWFQGESDTVRWSDANEYGRRMSMLVRQIRTDLGMPHLLVIQVGLASGLGQYTEVVREAQKGIKLRNVRFVDAKGLPLQDGHLHLSTQAQVQLGHMLAQSYLNYGHANSVTPKPWWLQIMLLCCFILL